MDAAATPDVRSLLREAAERLPGSDGAGRLEAEVLLSSVLGTDRVWLHAHPEAPVASEASRTFAGLVRERAEERTPVAYLTGVREFYGLTLRMRRGVFIPRPETEGLVDRVRAWLSDQGDRGAPGVIAEACCGSGAIGVALAIATGRRVIATDLSAAAIDLTRENAMAQGAGALVEALPGSLLEPVEAMRPRPSVCVVVSNPPYVTAAEMRTLPRDIASHEPLLALAAGEDGLDAVRDLISQTARILEPGGLVALEIGAGQGVAVLELLAKGRWRQARIERDLAGNDRYVLAVMAPGTAP